MVLLCLAPAAAADRPAPQTPYRKVLDEHVFVMQPGHCIARNFGPVRMSPKQFEQFLAGRQAGDVKDPCRKKNRTAAASIHRNAQQVTYLKFVWTTDKPWTGGARYPYSGLYRKGGSRDPVWTIPTYHRETYLTADGRYLAAMGPWASAFNSPAVSFYDRGRLLAEYAVCDLVANPAALPRTVSHFSWRAGKAGFDSDLGRLSLRTLEGGRFVFDLSSGKVTADSEQLNVGGCAQPGMPGD